jgi:hypothetical protein
VTRYSTPVIGRIRIKSEDPSVRVPDFMPKSVGFIAEVVEDPAGPAFDPCATGFFVSVASKVIPANGYFAFVTAKHVVDDLMGKKAALIVNRKGGGVITLGDACEKWFLHPTDTTADVAVLPVNLPPDVDILAISTDNFASPEAINKYQVGIGDEVFIVGLFTYAPGTKRNMPIVRHGNIAMLPDEQIDTSSGYANVYLVEARSIGGISGSPVFVRPTLRVPGKEPDGTDISLHGISGRMLLLGLMQAHWDIRESELNKPSFIQDRQRGVNLGIAVVVPAYKILETINHPQLAALRDAADREAHVAIAPQPDDKI